MKGGQNNGETRQRERQPEGRQSEGRGRGTKWRGDKIKGRQDRERQAEGRQSEGRGRETKWRGDKMKGRHNEGETKLKGSQNIVQDEVDEFLGGIHAAAVDRELPAQEAHAIRIWWVTLRRRSQNQTTTHEASHCRVWALQHRVLHHNSLGPYPASCTCQRSSSPASASLRICSAAKFLWTFVCLPSFSAFCFSFRFCFLRSRLYFANFWANNGFQSKFFRDIIRPQPWPLVELSGPSSPWVQSDAGNRNRSYLGQ